MRFIRDRDYQELRQMPPPWPRRIAIDCWATNDVAAEVVQHFAVKEGVPVVVYDHFPDLPPEAPESSRQLKDEMHFDLGFGGMICMDFELMQACIPVPLKVAAAGGLCFTFWAHHHAGLTRLVQNALEKARPLDGGVPGPEDLVFVSRWADTLFCTRRAVFEAFAFELARLKDAADKQAAVEQATFEKLIKNAPNFKRRSTPWSKT